MIGIWECQRCKGMAEVQVREDTQTLPRHTCNDAFPNTFGYMLQVGGRLEEGDLLYIAPETRVEPVTVEAPEKALELCEKCGNEEEYPIHTNKELVRAHDFVRKKT